MFGIGLIPLGILLYGVVAKRRGFIIVGGVLVALGVAWFFWERLQRKPAPPPPATAH
jgi:hypothetical protein